MPVKYKIAGSTIYFAFGGLELKGIFQDDKFMISMYSSRIRTRDNFEEYIFIPFEVEKKERKNLHYFPD